MSGFHYMDATADPAGAARVREAFGRWLRRNVAVSELRLCDVLLAVNEALANAAEFAYRHNPRTGTVDLEADLDPQRVALTVTVQDHGRWRIPDRQRGNTRGRGIPLMRSLTDGLLIGTSATGTSVALRFDNVDAAPPAEAPV